MKFNKDLGITLLISVTVIVIAYSFTHSMQNNIKTVNGDYSIAKTWKLPTSLNEVSGISWIADNKLACVQDETGIIYIYDLNKKAVIKEIPFAEKGDFEAIAVVDKDAYIMRSDGLVYVISNYDSDSKSVKTYQTDFDAKNNMESLTYNLKSKVLLTSPKDRDPNSDTYKGIYQLYIDGMKSSKQPLFKIDMNAEALKNFKGKKDYKTFSPSEIAIHPLTNDIYVLEGKDPKLLVLDPNGKLKAMHQFSSADFPQPEGITISPNGAIYISNEAKKGNATIHLVEFET